MVVVERREGELGWMVGEGRESSQLKGSETEGGRVVKGIIGWES